MASSDSIIEALNATTADFCKELALESLIEQQSASFRDFVSRFSVYKLRVGLEAVEAVTDPGPAREHLGRAVALGLVERGYDPVDGMPRYIVSDLVRPLVAADTHCSDPHDSYRRAADFLYRTWKLMRTVNEPMVLEIHRLARKAGSTEMANEIFDLISNTIEAQCARGDTHLQQGDVRRALEVYRSSLTLAKAIGNLRKTETLLRSMAGIYAQQKEAQRALELYQSALVALVQIGDVQGKAKTLRSMAVLCEQQEDVVHALEFYQLSLDLWEQIGDVHWEAVTLQGMALIYTRQGDVTRAIELYQSLLNLWERIGDVEELTAAMQAVAALYARRGETTRALEMYQSSLDLGDKAGNVQGKTVTLHAMAFLYAQQGDTRRALDLYETSLALQEQIGAVQGIAATLHAMAAIYVRLGDVERALDLYGGSLKLDQQIGNDRGHAATLGAMAGIHVQQGNVKQARELYQLSLTLAEKIGDIRRKAVALAQIGRLYFEEGDSGNSTLALRESAHDFVSVREWVDLHSVIYNLGVVDIRRAPEMFSQALWLAARIDVSADDLLETAASILDSIGFEAESAPLVAAGTMLLVTSRTMQFDADVPRWKASSLVALTAEARGICGQAAFKAWIHANRLDDPAYVLPQMLHALEKLVPDSEWIFDRRAVGTHDVEGSSEDVHSGPER